MISKKPQRRKAEKNWRYNVYGWLAVACISWIGLSVILTLDALRRTGNYDYRRNLDDWWLAGHTSGYVAGRSAGERWEFRRSEYNWSYRSAVLCTELHKHGLATDWPACDIEQCFYTESCPIPK